MSPPDSEKNNSEKNNSDKYFSHRANNTNAKLKQNLTKGRYPLDSGKPKKNSREATKFAKTPQKRKKSRKGPTFNINGLLDALPLPTNLKMPVFIATITVVFLAIFITTWALTNKNAYEVSLGDEIIGIVKETKDITEENLMKTANAKLEVDVGSAVRIEQLITFKEIHASKKELSSETNIISDITSKSTYKIEASFINVDGVDICGLKTAKEAEAVKQSMGKQYIGEGTELFSVEFDKDFQIIKKFVDPKTTVPTETAFGSLNKASAYSEIYTVQKGDNLGIIAQKHGLALNQLLEINPSYSPRSTIRENDKLNIISQRSFLSITTKEKTVVTRAIPKPTEIRENPDEYRTYSNMIQEGSEGEETATVLITRVNGIVTGEEEVLSREVLVAPVPEITEIGTSMTPKVM